MSVNDPIISFSVSSGAFMYQLGIGAYLQDNFSTSLDKIRFSGSSGGAWVSLILASGCSVRRVVERMFEVSQSFFDKRLLGGYGVYWKAVQKSFEEIWGKDTNPEDMPRINALLSRIRHRLGIAISVLTFGLPPLKGVVITEWHSLDDLYRCMISSALVPFAVNGFPFTLFRGQLAVDAGLTNVFGIVPEWLEVSDEGKDLLDSLRPALSPSAEWDREPALLPSQEGQENEEDEEALLRALRESPFALFPEEEEGDLGDLEAGISAPFSTPRGTRRVRIDSSSEEEEEEEEKATGSSTSSREMTSLASFLHTSLMGAVRDISSYPSLLWQGVHLSSLPALSLYRRYIAPHLPSVSVPSLFLDRYLTDVLHIPSQEHHHHHGSATPEHTRHFHIRLSHVPLQDSEESSVDEESRESSAGRGGEDERLLRQPKVGPTRLLGFLNDCFPSVPPPLDSSSERPTKDPEDVPIMLIAPWTWRTLPLAAYHLTSSIDISKELFKLGVEDARKHHEEFVAFFAHCA